VIVVIGLVFLPLTPPYDLDVFRRAGLAAVRGLPVYPRLNSAAVYSGSAFVYPYFTVWPFGGAITSSCCSPCCSSLERQDGGYSSLQ
jgi:hypothetical protein